MGSTQISAISALSFLLASLAIHPAHAGDVEIRSSRVRVFGDATKTDTLRDIAAIACQTQEQAQQFFAILGMAFPESRDLSIRTFLQQSELAKSIPKDVAQHINAFGSYNHDTAEIQLWLGTSEWDRITRHETLHHLLHARFPQIPPWLDEAIAEGFSRNETFLKSARVEKLPSILRDVLDNARATNRLGTYDDVFTLSHREFYGPDQDIRYAKGFAVIAYLTTTQEPRIVGNFLSAVAQGEDASSWLATKLGLTTHKLNAAVAAYVSK